MRFVLDPGKDALNQQKHGLSLAAGRAVLELPPVFRLTVYDREHSHDEDRWISLGLVDRGVLLVVHVETHDDEIRIVSVRRASREERRAYFAYLEGQP